MRLKILKKRYKMLLIFTQLFFCLINGCGEKSIKSENFLVPLLARWNAYLIKPLESNIDNFSRFHTLVQVYGIEINLNTFHYLDIVAYRLMF
mgnify:CR=1 FL=1